MTVTIGVVTRDKYITWEMKALRRAADRRGIRLCRIDPLAYHFDLVLGLPLDRRGEPVHIDVVLGRVDADSLQQGVRLLNLIEGAGIPVLNGSTAFRTGRDKCLTSITLKEADLPHPRTWILSPDRLSHIGERLPYPLVLKPPVGGKGDGVQRVSTPTRLRALARRMIAPLYVQEFCPNPGEDVRVMVLNGQILGAMRRKAQPGEWRANLALGAAAEPITLDAQRSRLAIRAAAALNAPFAGIDLIDGPNGPLILEVNVCPAFRGFCLATGVDVAGRLLSALTDLGGAHRREPM